MSRPLVSVIIPCYKQAHFLPECIASLQAQTMPDWEAIVVDDGSPDDAAAVAGALGARDTRVRLLRQPNGGLSAARNAGCASARGHFIQFLDADDLLLPAKLEAHLAACASLPPGTVTYTDYRHGKFEQPHEQAPLEKLDVRLQSVRPVLDLARRWEHFLSIPIHAALFPRNLVQALGESPFDTSLPNHEDWDFWMRIAVLSPGFHFIERELAIYRVSSTSMSRNPEAMWLGFKAAIAKQRAVHRGDPAVGAALRQLSFRNDLNHRRGLPGVLRAVMASRLFRQLPWPVQRYAASRLRLTR